MLTGTGTTPGYETISQHVKSRGLSLGARTLALRDQLTAMTERGQEYTEGSAADGVLWHSVQTLFNRGLADWRSPLPGIFPYAKARLLEFLARLPSSKLYGMSYAVEASRRMILQQSPCLYLLQLHFHHNKKICFEV